MIKKGFIVSAVGNNLYKVRIPEIHGIAGDALDVGNSVLPECPVCAPPNVTCNYAEGDIVYVAWENGLSPVIIGSLYIGEDKQFSSTQIKTNKITANKMSVNGVDEKNIATLAKNEKNIKESFDKVDERISLLESVRPPDIESSRSWLADAYKVLMVNERGKYDEDTKVNVGKIKLSYPKSFSYTTEAKSDVTQVQWEDTPLKGICITSTEPSTKQDDWVYIITQ